MYDMGEPRIKIVTMPKDTNPAGNIFGGWIMSQIDIAGALATRDLYVEMVVTVAVNSMEFHEPIFVGDVVSCYAKVIKVGNSSIQCEVQVTSERIIDGKRRCVKVTSAKVTYVSVDEYGKKLKIKCTQNEKLAIGLQKENL